MNQLFEMYKESLGIEKQAKPTTQRIVNALENRIRSSISKMPGKRLRRVSKIMGHEGGGTIKKLRSEVLDTPQGSFYNSMSSNETDSSAREKILGKLKRIKILFPKY